VHQIAAPLVIVRESVAACSKAVLSGHEGCGRFSALSGARRTVLMSTESRNRHVIVPFMRGKAAAELIDSLAHATGKRAVVEELQVVTEVVQSCEP
jgi:hypothetical protein